jgi:8-oxo-dGTP diphosphatase
MPHIHVEPGQHDLTASAYIVRTGFDEPKLLLHMHKKLGRYMQFGGHVELDENPWQAVTHEIREESGYELSQLTLLQPPDRIEQLPSGSEVHPQPLCFNTHSFDKTKHKHTDIAWLFTANQEPAHSVAEAESQELRLFTRKEIMSLPTKNLSPDQREIARFIFDVCLPKWGHLQAASI